MAKHQTTALQGCSYAQRRRHEETSLVRALRNAHEVHPQPKGTERGRAGDDDVVTDCSLH